MISQVIKIVCNRKNWHLEQLHLLQLIIISIIILGITIIATTTVIWKHWCSWFTLEADIFFQFFPLQLLPNIQTLR